jgi:alpha-L-fucosidase 2
MICRSENRWVIIALISLAIGIALWAGSPGPDTAPVPPEDLDPTTVLWYATPADKWENALPVGNGRLGAMVFGKTDAEEIWLNEETCWSGGPYSQAVRGGHKVLPEIQRLIFAGEYIEAHTLFGRHLMGYPVEQQKYQALGSLILEFPEGGEARAYSHRLDMDAAVVTTGYVRDGVRFTREVFSTPVDQVIAVRLTADTPGAVSVTANLRGIRNQAHSNYATDYFRMDGLGPDGLVVTGKSADYLGVEGTVRYEGRLRAVPEGGRMSVKGRDLSIRGADAVTFYVAAATNFVDYRDVSADPRARIEATLAAIADTPYREIRDAHVREHRRLFRRVTLDLGSTPDSFLPTDERRRRFDGRNDPSLAALLFQFGRYLLISSSRPGTQPANLQGLWNNSMNPMWDSKYTTNINTEMNYWIAESGNLSECAEPLFRMIGELADRGSEVAREHYGARGWVFHQNTDLWRAAAPMDGPQWGTFTTGGAWLVTHLWEHFLYGRDRGFLERAFPLMKGCAEFFLDFLVEHPEHGWLVTNPSNSPENYPSRPGNGTFYDEVTGWMSPGTTICAGSTIDMEILRDLFEAVARAADILGIESEFRDRVLETRSRLAPMRIGRDGGIMEWLEEWDQKEKSHRHISNLYGLFPGKGVSVSRTPELARAAGVVLDQRGVVGNGWASAWKMASWARLQEPERSMENLRTYVHDYLFDSLFAICSKAFQVDGSFGVAAAVAEMLLQSHEDEIHLLPSLPKAWPTGRIKGLRARGGFEIDLEWRDGRIGRAAVRSTAGGACRVRADRALAVTSGGRRVRVSQPENGVVEFPTEAGRIYVLEPGS